ncbi:MAG: phosphoribosylanthranilate isomerase [Rhodothermales bacterium]|nr:phosphoribosylanthranilate isomerase [Rhodothermales bacterium]
MTDDLRLQLKICGITKLEDARYAVAAGATHLGFIQDERSERFIPTEKAKEIIEWVYGAVPVGVFVDADLDHVNASVATAGFKMVQLHGAESVSYCASLQAPIIKVLPVGPDTTANELGDLAAAYSPVVDWLMFDTSRLAKSREPFNWNILEGVHTAKPFFLAGGINAENIAAAVEKVTPDGIDVSSGLESSPGIKDFDKIDTLIGMIEERL